MKVTEREKEKLEREQIERQGERDKKGENVTKKKKKKR
jgi:hypothetical protein